MKQGFGKLGGRHRRLSQRDFNPVAASRRLRFDPRLVTAEKDEQAPLGPRMLNRDPQEHLDELADLDLARHGLRGLDHRPDLHLRRLHQSAVLCLASLYRKKISRLGS
jgi:hypothetical protein